MVEGAFGTVGVVEGEEGTGDTTGTTGTIGVVVKRKNCQSFCISPILPPARRNILEKRIKIAIK